MFNLYLNKVILYFSIAFLAISCGLPPTGYLGHSTNTQVILSEANYRVIGTVKGSATGSIIFGFGPSQSRLYSRAKKDMLENANLSGGGNKSRAIINITTDEQINYFWLYYPFWISKTVYIAADVIEFKEN